MIRVIGIGVDGKDSLSRRQIDAIMRSGLLIGAKRHLDEFTESKALKIPVKGNLSDLPGIIKEYTSGSRGRGVAILATGDPLLFGIGDFIIRKFGKRSVEVMPNVSIIQEAFSRIKENSNGLKVLSVHGRETGAIDSVIDEVSCNDKVAIFTDQSNTPAKITGDLIHNGIGGYTAYVLESLGTPQEKVIRGTLRTISSIKSFSPLNILVLIKKKRPAAASLSNTSRRGFGIPDSEFSHSAGMITKAELRVIALSKMDIKSDGIVWDIGAGCGSIAVEAARLARRGRVYAIEKKKERIGHIQKNKKRFDAGNLFIIEGSAPSCLRSKELSTPDSVFIGGGGASMPAILDCVSQKIRKGGRIVVNAVTVETAHLVYEYFGRKDFNQRELLMVSLSRAKPAGGLSLLKANNPVFVITAGVP